MSELFLKIVNMSISAGWVILAVLILRLLLRKAPKWITVLMWGIVAVRLVCPFTIESVLSLIPSAETVSPEIMMDPMPTVHTGVPVINHTVNPVITGSLAPAPGDSVNPLQIWIPILSAVWLIGVVVLLVYTLISYIRLRLRVRTAVSLRDNVYESENVSSPFILGVIRPRIYLPFNVRSTDAEHVIAHEQAHIRRKDHLWKPIGYLLLAVHWFNPLVWLGYVLLCRDIELACDEKVVKNLDFDQRADYSQALLNCSVNRRMIAACPLAFGEVGVKDRVKSVLNYKKPAFWIIIIAIIASVIVAVCFLTDPKGEDDLVDNSDSEYTDKATGGASSKEWIDYFSSIFSGDKTDEADYICIEDYEEKIISIPQEEINAVCEYFYEQNGMYDLHTGFQNYCTVKGIIDVAGEECYYGRWAYLVENEDGEQTHASTKCEFVLSKDYAHHYDAYTKDGDLYVGVSRNYNQPVNDFLEYVDELKAKYPMYFNLPTSKGLVVYIWQMSEDSYSCGLLPGSETEHTDEEIWSLHEAPSTLAEMLTIVSSYSIPKNEVSIMPIVMPHSSYAYTIDEAYCKSVEQTFWYGDFVNFEKYNTIIDSAVFDIDGDGNDEECFLRIGPTYGINTTTISAYKNGELEYYNLLWTAPLDMSFEEKSDGTVVLRGEMDGNVYYADIFVNNGYIFLSGDKDIWALGSK